MDDRMIESLIERRTEKAEKPSPLFAANWPEIITQAASRHDGARYYRCALQVNTPFQDSFKGFDSHHRRGTAAYQRDYASKLAQECKKNGIDVIGLCDHNSVAYVKPIRDELGEENIIVFPGFEVASTEGIHVLCLFDPDREVEDLNHLLTELGLPPKERWTNGEGLAPRQSPMVFPDIVERVQRNRKGICIAAHVDRENGLLHECAKTTRVQYFIDPNLLAAQIAGRREDLMDFYRKVVDNELTHYHRQQKVALLNCLDVYNLKDLSKPECSTWIKMSSPSFEGLWQAFLDPDSRLRLLSEEPPKPHAELVAIAWQGGFLDGGMIHFNENLNCLIGGRGAGKSTVIESLRYVLDLEPIGDDARQTHEEILQQVLSEDTRISLLVRSHRPAPCHYLIERSHSQKPLVRDESGDALQIHPTEILSGVEIFGQHEIAEIAKDRAKQHQLLQRFRDAEAAAECEAQKRELLRHLKANRQELLRTQNESEALAEKLSRLPAVEEKLRRYKELGIEAKLKEQSQLAAEEALLKTSRERFMPVKKALEQLRRVSAQNAGPLETAASTELPNADLWERLDAALADFDEKMQACLDDAGAAINEADKELLEIAAEWQKRRQEQQSAPDKNMQELKAADSDTFLKLRREYEALAPLKKEARRLEQNEEDLKAQRLELLQAWEELKWRLFELDQDAAERISHELKGLICARVAKEGNLAPLFDLLLEHHDKKFRDAVAGKLNEEHPIVIADFVQHIRDGKRPCKKSTVLPPSEPKTWQTFRLKKFSRLKNWSCRLRFTSNSTSPKKSAAAMETDARAFHRPKTAILLILFLESEARW
jgi:hypothetical protein